MTVKFNKKMLLLLFVVILLIGISVVIAAFNRQEKDELVEIEYRVVFENVDEGFREKIKEGEIVYNSRTMAAVGRVVSVESGENYFVYEYDGESQIIKREYPNRYNIDVVIGVTANFSNGEGYSVEGARIAVGKELEFRFSDFVGRGFCRDLWTEAQNG